MCAGEQEYGIGASESNSVLGTLCYFHFGL